MCGRSSICGTSIAVAFLDSVGDGSSILLFSGFAALEEERERRFGTNVANRRRDGDRGRKTRVREGPSILGHSRGRTFPSAHIRVFLMFPNKKIDKCTNLSKNTSFLLCFFKSSPMYLCGCLHGFGWPMEQDGGRERRRNRTATTNTLSPSFFPRFEIHHQVHLSLIKYALYSTFRFQSQAR